MALVIVCICARGNVRSATAAMVLRDFFGCFDVVATGLQTTSTALLRELANRGATFLVVGDDTLVSQLQVVLGGVTRVIDFQHINVGVDRWMMPAHPDLVATLIDALTAAGFTPTGFGADKNRYLAAHTAAWNRHHVMVAA